MQRFSALLALLAYVFLWEPFSGLRQQTWIWAVGYLLYLGTAFMAFQRTDPQLAAKIKDVAAFKADPLQGRKEVATYGVDWDGDGKAEYDHDVDGNGKLNTWRSGDVPLAGYDKAGVIEDRNGNGVRDDDDRRLAQAIQVEAHLWMRAIPWMESLQRPHPIWMVALPMVGAHPRTEGHPLTVAHPRTIPPRVTVEHPLMAVRQRTIPLRVTVARPPTTALPMNSGCRQ